MSIKEKILLEEISQIIGKFLIENGGLSNGFCTYAKGYVSPNTYGSLKVDVNNDDLSKNELRKLSNRLEQKIQQFMKKARISETIVVTSTCLEYGVYETYINFEAPTLKVSLPIIHKK